MASIYNQTVTEADARLVRVDGDPKLPGFVLVRSWPQLAGAAASGDTVGSLVQTWLDGTPITTRTDPKANGVTYTGTFVVSGVDALDEDREGTSDRATTIIETLTKVTTVASSSDLSNPFIRQNNLIVFPLRNETGEADGMVLTYSNLNPASRQVLMETVTDAQLKAIADALVTGTPWTYESRDFKEENDKTATFTVVFLDYNSDATSDDGTDSIVSEIKKAVGSNRSNINIQTKEKVPAAIADSIMSDGTGWDIPSGYALLTLRRANHQDGTATVYQISTKAVTWTFNTNADDQFEVVFWGSRTEMTKDNELVLKREVSDFTERLYTNTQANAESWANDADVSAAGYASTSYTVEKGKGASRQNGWLTQQIRGDYRWIAYRQSDRIVGQQVAVTEV